MSGVNKKRSLCFSILLVSPPKKKPRSFRENLSPVTKRLGRQVTTRLLASYLVAAIDKSYTNNTSTVVIF